MQWCRSNAGKTFGALAQISDSGSPHTLGLKKTQKLLDKAVKSWIVLNLNLFKIFISFGCSDWVISTPLSFRLFILLCCLICCLFPLVYFLFQLLYSLVLTDSFLYCLSYCWNSLLLSSVGILITVSLTSLSGKLLISISLAFFPHQVLLFCLKQTNKSLFETLFLWVRWNSFFSWSWRSGPVWQYPLCRID